MDRLPVHKSHPNGPQSGSLFWPVSRLASRSLAHHGRWLEDLNSHNSSRVDHFQVGNWQDDTFVEVWCTFRSIALNSVVRNWLRLAILVHEPAFFCFEFFSIAQKLHHMHWVYFASTSLSERSVCFGCYFNVLYLRQYLFTIISRHIYCAQALSIHWLVSLSTPGSIIDHLVFWSFADKAEQGWKEFLHLCRKRLVVTSTSSFTNVY